MSTPQNTSGTDKFSGLSGSSSPDNLKTTKAVESSPDLLSNDLSLSNNTYSNTYDTRESLDLESSAPALDSTIGRNVNKKAIAFLFGVGTLAILGSVWAFSTFMPNKSTEKKEPTEEVVTIPDAPKSTIAKDATLPSTAQTASETPPPIPVVNNSLPPPPVMNQSVQTAPSVATMPLSPPIDPYVEQRRQASTIVNAVGNTGGSTGSDGGDTDRGSATLLRNAENLLLRGTYIRCVLETKIVTDIPGFTSCIVTEPVYSTNGKKLLLAKGSKVSGRYQQSEVDGPRIAVVWDRITTPNGYDVRIQSPGVDNLGGAGHIGDYKSHWPSRIGSALLISLISDTFKYAAAQYGPESTTTTSTSTTQSPYDSATAKTIESAANNALARAARRPATVTINQGTLLNIYTARDIDFSTVLSQ